LESFESYWALYEEGIYGIDTLDRAGKLNDTGREKSRDTSILCKGGKSTKAIKDWPWFTMHLETQYLTCIAGPNPSLYGVGFFKRPVITVGADFLVNTFNPITSELSSSSESVASGGAIGRGLGGRRSSGGRPIGSGGGGGRGIGPPPLYGANGGEFRGDRGGDAGATPTQPGSIGWWPFRP